MNKNVHVQSGPCFVFSVLWSQATYMTPMSNVNWGRLVSELVANYLQRLPSPGALSISFA